MKIFAIHKSKDEESVRVIRQRMAKLPHAKLLLLENTTSFWKLEAKKLIRQADIAIYFIGAESSDNIRWELEVAQSAKCKIYLIQLDQNAPIPSFCYEDSYDRVPILKYEVKTISDLLTELEVLEAPILHSLFNDNLYSENLELRNKYLLSQYTLFLESTERLTDRRQNLTSTYLTIVTALLPVVLYMLSSDNRTLHLLTVVISSIAILMCFSWMKMIESYGKVSSTKYAILQQIEKRLPLSILDAEWLHLSQKVNNYVSFTHRERMFPHIFMMINITLIFVALVMYFA